MSTETNPFATGEGDAWYHRNKDTLEAYQMDKDPVHQLVKSILEDPECNYLVDIGCSSGDRLSAMCAAYKKVGLGMDLSNDAIKHNVNKLDNNIIWEVGSLINWNWKHYQLMDKYQLIMTIFVWHWLPREELLGSMDNLTKKTRPGDYLVIGDFRANHRTRRKYHHLPNNDVWTWKAPYDQMLIITGLWKFVSMRSIGMIDHIREYTLLKRIDPKEGYREESANGHSHCNPPFDP